MNVGEWLTHGTIWLALALYVAAEAIQAAKRDFNQVALAVWLNRLGCAAFLAHVACAFHFYHQWSHSVAYADTARETAKLFGWNWGGGLFFNYLFAIIWIGEAAWRWMKPAAYARRALSITCGVRSFFFFMIFNGAVVFPQGVMRWFGLVLCVTLIVCWWKGRNKLLPNSRHPN